jgi:hypothetical protein
MALFQQRYVDWLEQTLDVRSDRVQQLSPSA